MSGSEDFFHMCMEEAEEIACRLTGYDKEGIAYQVFG